MIKELWYLIKLLFSPLSDQIDVVQMKHFPFKGYLAMSWCGKIITRENNLSTIAINHERIHLEQALQFKSWVKYYLVYLYYWTLGNPFSKASYYTIPFEMEACGKELDFDYNPTKNSWKKYKIKDRKKTFNAYLYNWRQYCRKLV